MSGISTEDIAEAQARKNNKNGAFKKGIFVDHVQVNKNDKWVEYYQRNSDRYPEID